MTEPSDVRRQIDEILYLTDERDRRENPQGWLGVFHTREGFRREIHLPPGTPPGRYVVPKFGRNVQSAGDLQDMESPRIEFRLRKYDRKTGVARYEEV